MPYAKQTALNKAKQKIKSTEVDGTAHECLGRWHNGFNAFSQEMIHWIDCNCGFQFSFDLKTKEILYKEPGIYGWKPLYKPC